MTQPPQVVEHFLFANISKYLFTRKIEAVKAELSIVKGELEQARVHNDSLQGLVKEQELQKEQQRTLEMNKQLQERSVNPNFLLSKFALLYEFLAGFYQLRCYVLLAGCLEQRQGNCASPLTASRLIFQQNGPRLRA